ncbi:MAG: aminopeptidase P family protein [Bacteroidaceae bacterium]|nr:aminopeptidase P family protein [Bacteroidaceae bacterium]
MNIKDIPARVEALRGYMREHGLAAYIVLSSDAHSSEYVADCWKAREWVSGFDGSAGTAVVTLSDARLWTDSRYWLAAENALAGTGFSLMKDGDKDTPTITDWLCTALEQGSVVGVDGSVCSIAEAKEWAEALSMCGLSLNAAHDPFKVIWKDRPTVPTEKAVIMPCEVSGESAAGKLQRLRQQLSKNGVEGMLVTMLDEVAWLTNLRGNDVAYNPVVVSYLLVTTKAATLFILPEKLTSAVLAHLAESDIAVADYNDVWGALAAYNGDSILLQPTRCNRAVLEHLNPACQPVFKDSPVAAMKAVKNSVEIEGFKEAMLAEGIAMVKLLHWLKPAVERGGITELDVDKQLTAYRSENVNFAGLSFATIAAYGPNAAIVHYEPTEECNALLQSRGFLLLDCGGQYNCGTTDITRTIPLGPLSEEERRSYTLVLRGHISLAMAKFPLGTCGTQLDVLARQWLWQEGENYLHGTGHGVGHYLNVHEGPHQIRMNNMPAPLLPGVTVTNEPGLYKAGRYGIRIENTMLVKHHCETEFGSFCAMEPLTLCPIDTTAVIPSLLGADAIAYLNEYHKHVYETLAPHLSGPELEFLKEACKPI